MSDIDRADSSDFDRIRKVVAGYALGSESLLPEFDAIVEASHSPVPLILTCPACSERHIDEGEFATRPHRTHRCSDCGLEWRPANIPTVGVRYLPGQPAAAPRPTTSIAVDPWPNGRPGIGAKA